MNSITLNESSKESTNEKPSQDTIQDSLNNEKRKTEKEIFFIILYQRKQKESKNDLVFSKKSDIIPINILIHENEEGKEDKKSYFYKKVFKFKNIQDTSSKKTIKYNLDFNIGKDNYIVSFENKDNSFIYDVELKKGNKFLQNIAKENINQKVIEYYDKLDIFLETLKKNKEEDKIDRLFEETIELYSKKKDFSFLISLFVQIYNKKSLCSLLIDKFYDMNIKLTENEKSTDNLDRNKNLEQYNSYFSQLISESDNLIKDYDPIKFNAIILCYLNYYDYKNFLIYMKKLYTENWEVLYEILVIYFVHFLKPIEQNFDFFVKFISHIILKRDFSHFKIGLNFIIDTETFISVIEKTKEEIINKYAKNDFKPITLKASLTLKKEDKIKEMDELIIPAIDKIINFSKKQKVLLIYFSSNYWINLLKNFNEPNPESIDICFKLREIFIKYNNLVNDLFKNEKKNDIKKDINKYFEIDEFAFILDKNIRKYIETNKELSNSEILGYIQNYNPYYKEDKYAHKRETYIFDYVNFENNDDQQFKQFIDTFKNLKFEIIFKDNITEFLNKMVSKITNIYTFDTIMELININGINSKVDDFLGMLKDKYEYVIKKEVESLTGVQLKEAVKVIAKFVDLIFINENNNYFIENKINKLDKKISPLIYNELMRRCKGDKYKNMKNFIFKQFLNKIDNINNIIDLIDSLGKDDETAFLKELMKKCKFTKEEFYTSNDNTKILLLCELYEKGKIKNEGNIYGELETILTAIFKDMDGEININKLNEFFDNKKEVVIKRLGLIKFLMQDFNPGEQYSKLKKIIEDIKIDIAELTYIKNALTVFHRVTYKKEIKDIINIIRRLEDGKIKDYNNQEIKGPIGTLKKQKIIAEKVNSVKDFLLFKVIYETSHGNDQEKRFQEAVTNLERIKELFDKNTKANKIYEQNKKIFEKIKELLSYNESKAEKFIEQMKEYFNIKENKELEEEITILFKSKKYEIDIKSIIYFFESFETNNSKWNKRLSTKYEELSKMNLGDLKKNLEELKTNEIYNYQIKSNYSRLFTSLYEKKEAIDFLLTKTEKDISVLYDRIEPTNRTITIKNIQDTEECLKVFNKFKELKDNFKIFDYIKSNLTEDQISKFEIYSKIYTSVIELARNDDSTLNVFDKVNNIIKNAIFIFLQDNEDFSYGKEEISMEELIHLKNKIHIKPQKEIKKTKEEKDKQDQFQEKCDKLVFFKNTISNLEVIYEYMKILRTKGSSLPINIKIIIKYPNIEYFINRKESDFEKIRDFLFKAKTDYISQLDIAYKTKNYLRFLYGKLFRSIMKHLDGSNISNVIEILRFILNKTDNKELKDGEATNPQIDDYVNEYHKYNEKSFDNILDFMTSLFEKNGTSLQQHYESILMKDRNKHKGIYLHECENISIEEFIFKIFLEKIGQIPSAQNILICSKETSSEEMQAFFYRAILWDYNTLYVVEINNSISDYQQSIMYNYIDILLSYKSRKYKENEKKNIDTTKTKEYLDSCIVFVYEKKNKDNISFLNEIGKLEKQQFKDNENKTEEQTKENSNNSSLISSQKPSFENIRIITSDVCGLGKSYKIRKMIKDKQLKYFHFPLGGILTKTVIFKKLSALLKKIKNANANYYKDVAIHLDLTESKETTIIKEFLFSFLITKFYTDNENIIYIPIDIEIYIEIPNCFENYLSKFGILNLFNLENIELDNMPKFDLPIDIISIFERMLGYKTNEEIEEFVKKYIGIEKYSFHQIQMFIKLFISQYNMFNSKLKFTDGGKDVTEQCIKDFAKSTKYFTYGGFAKLLIDKNYYNPNKNYIDLLSDIYDNDLNGTKFDIPLIFIIKEKMKYEELIIPETSSKKYKNSKDYLKRMKEILYLPNDVEKDEGNYKSLLSILDFKTDNYVITNDNFKKMVLLVYRIKANVPVIIMGETGCGKTALVTKLNQILNNGEILVEIINIHPGITDNDLCEKLGKINDKAKKLKEKEKEIWVFFDEINTCLSLSLLTEIFINRTYNGEKLDKRIRLIGACNPYRRRKIGTERCGLRRDEDDDDDNELVYLVQPLPQSLLYYVFSFGSINEDDEKKYIYSIIEKLFSNDEKELHEITRDAIFECHKYLREAFDPSVVSLREISRFSKIVDFFQKYYIIKNEYEENKNRKLKDYEIIQNIEKGKEKLYKIKSIICSIYLCYYIKLTDNTKRGNFNNKLRDVLLRLVNIGLPEEKKGPTNEDEINDNIKNNDENNDDVIGQIKNKELKRYMNAESMKYFSDFLKIEEEFLLDRIELNKGIGRNDLLRENVFLLFVSVVTKIPLIIVGKPGTGKSLSAQLIYKSMRGKYSKEKFFQKFPQIIQTYFQGSESTKPEDVEKLFEIAENQLKSFVNKKENKKEELPYISMILFDELGLAEKSESNPLKALHSRLEYAGKAEGVSFVGISNYSLDAAKINRALNLSVPNLEDKIDQLKSTSKSIVESISEDLCTNKIFDILSSTYSEYKITLKLIKELTALKQFNSKNNKKMEIKKKLFAEIKNIKEFKNLLKKEKKIKVDFHGNRDLYNFIKGIAIKTSKLSNFDENEVVAIIDNYIERNFGGIDYEINVDLNLKPTDIEGNINSVSEILREFYIKEKKEPKKKNKQKDKKTEKDEKIKISSVLLFKKIYNKQCEIETENSYKIKPSSVNSYDLNRCINDNITDSKNRYLLLEIKSSLSSLIHQNIKIQNPEKDIEFYDGSPFVDDNNNEYKFKKVNEIQDDAKSEKLIILQNLNQIQPFLYDLYNMNYIIKDEQKYARICLDSFSEQLTPVNDLFRIIILVDRKFINGVDMAFLNRLEKMKITFDKLLDFDQKLLAQNLIEEINFKYYIEKYPINYVLKDLLINCGKEEIEGLIYNLFIELKKNNNKINENEINERVCNKIIKILPQDIICILPENHIIRKKYYEEKKYYNFKNYINDEENKGFKISIIYTFNGIAGAVVGINNDMRFMVMEIKTEDQLRNKIEEIKNRNEDSKLEKNYNIFIHFEQFNTKKIQFISSFIIKNFKEDKYNYIFIIHIQRNFNAQINDRIYTIPDINPDINQLFIDNLNAANINLNDLLEKKIKDIMEDNGQLMDLNREFKRTLTNFVYKELNEKRNTINISNSLNNKDYDKKNSIIISNENNKINEDNYEYEIIRYMDKDEEFKDKIIDKAKKLIDSDKEAEGDCKKLIDKILKMNYIGKNSLDIISCLLDYIKEEIFNKYLKYIFTVLEDNNFLTTLLEIKNNKSNSIEENIIEKLKEKSLEIITIDKNIYEPKFLFNYKIPGFYNFYRNLSNYINKNITIEYFNNEKNLRK